jgi:hypothetical protein
MMIALTIALGIFNQAKSLASERRWSDAGSPHLKEGGGYGRGFRAPPHCRPDFGLAADSGAEPSAMKRSLFAAVVLGVGGGTSSGFAQPIDLASSTSGEFDFAATGNSSAPLIMSTLGAPVSGPASFGSDSGTYTFGVFNDTAPPTSVANTGAEGTGACAGARPPCFPITSPNTDTLTVTLGNGSNTPGNGTAQFTVTFDTVQANSTTPALIGTFDTTSADGDLSMFASMGPIVGTVTLTALPGETPLTLAELVDFAGNSEFGAFAGDLGLAISPPPPPPISLLPPSIPEPASLVLLASGLLGLPLVFRRRNRS